MKLSNQAMGAIMMALQKSLMEQSDIVPVLGEFDFQLNEEEKLDVLNAPTLKFDDSQENDEFFSEKNYTTGSD